MSFGRLFRKLLALLAMAGFSNAAFADLSEGWGQEFGQESREECCDTQACGWGYTPQYYGNCGACDGFLDRLVLRADYLYWQATEDGLDLGTLEDFHSETIISGVNTATTTDNKERASKLNFKYDSGVRVGFMFLLPCDGWDTTVNWTYFANRASVHSCGLSPTQTETANSETTDFIAFAPSWEREFDLLPDCASGKWTLNLNLLDWELGRRFYLSPSVIARPHIGLRFASIDQNYHASSIANPNSFQSGLLALETSSKASCKFMGIGIRTGLDLDYKVGCGFSLVGQAAASLVYGRFRNHSGECQSSSYVDDSDPSNLGVDYYDEYFNASYRFRRSHCMFDFALGVRWEECFCVCNKYHPVGFSVLWEQHAFLRMNQFRFDHAVTVEDSVEGGAFVPNVFQPKEGDLTTQGLTVSFFLGF